MRNKQLQLMVLMNRIILDTWENQADAHEREKYRDRSLVVKKCLSLELMFAHLQNKI
jgi:hypothetical protein